MQLISQGAVDLNPVLTLPVLSITFQTLVFNSLRHSARRLAVWRSIRNLRVRKRCFDHLMIFVHSWMFGSDLKRVAWKYLHEVGGLGASGQPSQKSIEEEH